MPRACIEDLMTNPPSALFVWGGRVLTALPVLMLLFSAAMKFKGGPEFEQGLAHMGVPASLAMPLGILELTVTLLYAIPRTSMLGAILLAGYLGGAMMTHIRVGDPWIVQFLLGVIVWGGLWFRDERVRKLIPIVQPQS